MTEQHTEQPVQPTPEGWMLHDMEFATVVTVRKPGRFITLCDGSSFTREENLVHAELIIADHGAAAERDRLVVKLEVAINIIKFAQRRGFEWPADPMEAIEAATRIVLSEASKPETEGVG